MNDVKTWQHRLNDADFHATREELMQAEINELRAALAERGAKLAALEKQEPMAWLVYANGSHRYSTLTFDVSKVPDIYVGGDVVALYAAAGAAPVPEGWQPIETAPKDGLPFRAYSKDLIDLDFNPNGSVECCWDGAEFVGCVWDGQQDAWYGKAISPTHWMLLPAAPKEQTP